MRTLFFALSITLVAMIGCESKSSDPAADPKAGPTTKAKESTTQPADTPDTSGDGKPKVGATEEAMKSALPEIRYYVLSEA